MEHPFVGTEHLALAFIRHRDGMGAAVLQNMGVSFGKLEEALRQAHPGNKDIFQDDSMDQQRLAYSSRVKRVLEFAAGEAHQMGHLAVGSEHLLLGLLREQQGNGGKVLRRFDLTLEEVRQEVLRLHNHQQTDKQLNAGPDGAHLPAARPQQTSSPSTRTEPEQSSSQRKRRRQKYPALDKYCEDLTFQAVQGELDPVVGRREEIYRIVEVLYRRHKNNPVLVGPPGVGKTAIVEGLAQNIVDGGLGEATGLQSILQLDIAALVAGAGYRGAFEKRIKQVLEELGQREDAWLFVDEVHTLGTAGKAEGGMQAANILKPALARGEVQMIGATTEEEYRKYIEKDGALARRLQRIEITEPDHQETVQMLKGVRGRYEQHHRVAYPETILDQIVRLADRYIQDQHLPDKAFDVLDETGARVQMQEEPNPHPQKPGVVQQPTVREKHVAEVVARQTGLPSEHLTEEEKERLMGLEEKLEQVVLGQPEAVQAVARSVRRGRAGLRKRDRPIGSFLFCGPTGVGKTELARQLAQQLYADQEALIRVDMSEFMERFNTSRLTGAPPGYVGYEQGGDLVEQVRQQPHSVILLDEVEKAHPEVLNLLLQVLEEGNLTSGEGRTADFSQAVVIMTSNLGTKEAQQSSMGFHEHNTPDNNPEIIQDKIEEHFSPEFLGRLDEVIIFDRLSTKTLSRIVELEMRDVRKRLDEKNISLHVTQRARQWIARQGNTAKFGARPLQRTIKQHLEDPLSERLLEGTLQEGGEIFVWESDDREQLIIGQVAPSFWQDKHQEPLSAPQSINQQHEQ